MSEYTPTTKDVREVWIYAHIITHDEGEDFHGAEFDRWLAAHDAEVRAGVVAEEPEGFYVIPNRDAPDQDSLWDGTIHPTREAAQASLNDAVIEWGQDAANYHVVAMVPVEQGDDDERS